MRRSCTDTKARDLSPTVDLVVTSDLSRWTWKDEDEYAHVRRLGIIDDTEHQAVDDAHAQVFGMLAARSGPFAAAERWTPWRWGLPGPRRDFRSRTCRGEGCTGGRLNRCLGGCLQRGTAGVNPPNLRPPLCPGQPPSASPSRKTTPPSCAVAVRKRSASLPRPDQG